MAKVLVIDDDPDFQDAVRLMLEKAQFEVEVASNADEGLAKVKSTSPDLVVLDVMMPSDYEGFAVARAIREELKLTKLPLVILSAIHEQKHVPYRFAVDATYLPVDVFLDKPVDTARLVDTVKELLGQQRIEPELPL
ncbi:MAG: response regulator [Phycisphaerae bacterium]|jgi:DNA-binding response OmpR family regulator